MNDIAMGAFHFAGADGKIGGDSLSVLELARSIDEVAVARTNRSLVVGHGFRLNMHGEFRLGGSQLSGFQALFLAAQPLAGLIWRTDRSGGSQVVAHMEEIEVVYS
jgi:hypothetical protein